MRAWLAETIYWITFIVIKQITFPHFWITFGGKLIFLLFLLLCHKRYYRNYILWFTYLFSLFPPRIKSWPWTGSGRVFSGSGSWPKYGAGFVKTWDILTANGILGLPGKRDSPKFKHAMLDFFFACMLEIREIIRLNGKCESTRRALSVVSFQTKL